MTIGELAAIRAIVAVAHPHHHLLTAIDAAIEVARKHETPSQTEVTTVGLGGSDGTL